MRFRFLQLLVRYAFLLLLPMQLGTQYVLAEEAAFLPLVPHTGALAVLPEDFMICDPQDEMEMIELGGEAVGGGGQPSAFYLAAREVLDARKATEENYLELSKHWHPTVRTIGMAGLAEKGTAAGIARLKEMLSSTQSAVGFPVGCLSGRLDEAHIAWCFLTGREFLCFKRREPLLTAEQTLELAFEMLARNDTAGTRTTSGWICPAPQTIIGTNAKLTLRLDQLQKLVPQLQPYQIVKALGRTSPQRVTGFLLEVLQDRTADGKTRLAALSSLVWARMAVTEQDKRNYHDVFKDMAAEFDALSPGKWGQQFLQALEPSQSEKSFRSLTPIGLASLFSKSEKVSFNESDLSQLAKKLLANRKTFRAWEQPWNAFGDTLTLLEIYVNTQQSQHSPTITKASKAAILDAIKQVRATPLDPD